jgi:hypothetical protein
MADPSFWSAMWELWALQGEPLRPPAEAVDRMVAAAGSFEGPMLLLGVTPEFFDRFSQITAIDNSKAMVKRVWPGDQPGKRAIVGSWQAELPHLGKFQVILGDGSVNTQPSLEHVGDLFRAIDCALSPDGRLVMRVYCQPLDRLSEDELVDQIAVGRIGFHALRLRIGMYLAQIHGDQFVPVRNIAKTFDHLFPNRKHFVERCPGMTPEHFALIDTYRNSRECWYVPHQEELRRELGMIGDNVRLVNSGTYAFSKDCPIAIVQRQ